MKTRQDTVLALALESTSDHPPTLKILFFQLAFLKEPDKVMTIKVWQEWLIMTAASKTGIVDANYDDHRIWA